MAKGPKKRGPGKLSAHGAEARPNNSNDQSKFVRFPDYVLCGSLNLHKSPENAASLAKYLANQWRYLRINKEGVISSKQLEINRDP